MPAAKKKASDGDNSEPAAKLNKTSSDYGSLSFDNESKSKDGKSWNFKVSSWNVDGLRAWIKKGGLEFLDHEKPDVLCLQEIKCSQDKIPDEIKSLAGYKHQYYMSADKDGYAGVALLSKTKPIEVKMGVGAAEHDAEGRLITAEFESFYLVTTYVPNAGRKLVTLDKRMEWDPLMRDHVVGLDKTKPVVVCGDLNVAHAEIDLANPKTNKKSAGFTPEERNGFSDLLKAGFVDTFRHFYPKTEKKYTFWTYMMNARAKNVGWRLDYFVASERFVDASVCDNQIRDQVYGSDHCPSTLFLAL